MPYQRPPITEAVIELRFAHAFEQKAVEDAAKRLAADGEYFYQDPEKTVEFKFDAVKETSAQKVVATGIKLSSLDRADVLIFRTNSFVCSRLAPYLQWDTFKSRATRGWSVWRKVAGPIELSRIGVRYVNRIDIPPQSGPSIRVEDYLNLSPRLPAETREPLKSYAMQIVFPLESTPYTVILNSGTVPSPLVGYTSFLLDLDISRETELPRRDDALWQVLDEMREHKNRVFENYITDLSRRLFSQ